MVKNRVLLKNEWNEKVYLYNMDDCFVDTVSFDNSLPLVYYEGDFHTQA